MATYHVTFFIVSYKPNLLSPRKPATVQSASGSGFQPAVSSFSEPSGLEAGHQVEKRAVRFRGFFPPLGG